MQIELLAVYRENIRRLRRHSTMFHLIEAHTKVKGLTTPSGITTLCDQVADHVKDLITLVDDPFGEAVLDNIDKSTADLAAALDVFEETPVEEGFDAREVLNLEVLSKAVDTIFRSVVAIKSRQGLSLPRAVISLDLAVHEVLASALEFFGETPPDERWCESLTNRMVATSEPIITFSRLESQKYFNDEETQAIRDAEDRKQAAIREAEKRAAIESVHDELMSKINELIRKCGLKTKPYFVEGFDNDMLRACIEAYDSLKMSTFYFNNTTEFVTHKPVKASGLAVLSIIVSRCNGLVVRFVNESHVGFDDVTNKAEYPANEIITMVVDK